MSLEKLLGKTRAELKSVPAFLVKYETKILAKDDLKDNRDASLNLLDEEILESLNNIGRNCEHLYSKLLDVPSSKRNQSRMSIDQIKYECKLLRGSYEALQRKRNNIDQDLRNREELLAFEFAPNSSLHNRKGDATVLQLDAEIDQNTRLTQVGSRLDEMLANAQASLTSLREQGLSLRDARKKIVDIAKSLGLSNTVMRLIERRTKEDKVLFWCLAVASIIIMFLIWKFLKA